MGRGRREWGDVPQVEVGTTVIHRRHCEEVGSKRRGLHRRHCEEVGSKRRGLHRRHCEEP